MRETIDIVKERGGKVLADRSDGAVELEALMHGLIRLKLETFSPTSCPRDLAGIPGGQTGQQIGLEHSSGIGQPTSASTVAPNPNILLVFFRHGFFFFPRIPRSA